MGYTSYKQTSRSYLFYIIHVKRIITKLNVRLAKAPNSRNTVKLKVLPWWTTSYEPHTGLELAYSHREHYIYHITTT